VLGLIEGVAEATASITKLPFGQAADHTGRHRVFVVGGHRQAHPRAVVRVAGGPRRPLRQGMRAAARDDLIATRTKPEQQGLAFGLHDSMDTMGAESDRCWPWRSFWPTSRCAGSSRSPSYPAS